MLQFLVEFRFGASKEIQPISFAVFLVVAVVLFTGIEITEKIKNAVEELKKVPSKEPPASFEG